MTMKNFIVVGASGDLAKNYIFPALSNLYKTGTEFNYYGFGRTDFSAAQFSQIVTIATENQQLTDRFTYVTGNYDHAGFAALKGKLKNPDSIFYLAIPTSYELVSAILTSLHDLHLVTPDSMVVIEKPFGTDLASAKLLMDRIKNTIGYSRVFLVDHYLTKELVKNIITLRFANPIFQNLWSNKFIKDITIVATETKGIDDRGQYYDKTGAIRDVIQNHCLQLASLITMCQPEAFSPHDFVKEKMSTLKNMRLFLDDFDASVSIGQYRGYRQENGVDPQSTTETKAELIFEVDKPQWRGVPIKIITGKKLSQKRTEIQVTFRQNLDCLWGDKCVLLPPNRLTINIFPSNEIRLTINSEFNPAQNLPTAVDLRLGYTDENQVIRTAYENVIADIAADIRINTPSYQEIIAQWQLIDPIVHHPNFAAKLKEY